MATLTLPAALAALLPEDPGRSGQCSVALRATSWQGAATELRDRFPALAKRVLDDDGNLARGFLMALNDQIVPRNQHAFELVATDELCIIPQLAGG